jgi:8-oxo-dGTP diphosphatase
MLNTVHVAVGVIISTSEENIQIFLTKRLQNAHQGGKWEFPGGKVESNETVAQALSRELIEEVDIKVLSCLPLMTIEHDYGDKKVCLDVFVVDNYEGEPYAQEGQQDGWFTLNALKELDFPEANQAIIAKLSSLYS